MPIMWLRCSAGVVQPHCQQVVGAAHRNPEMEVTVVLPDVVLPTQTANRPAQNSFSKDAPII